MSDTVQSASAPPVQSTSNQYQGNRNRPNHSGGGGGYGGRRDRDRDRDRDEDANNRRKRPELQHYKPGAFSSKNTRHDSYGHDGGHHDGGHHNYNRKDGGGYNRRNNYGRKSQADMEHQHVSQKMNSMHINSNANIENHDDESKGGGGGSGRNKKKKPDQAHYVPKRGAAGEPGGNESGQQQQQQGKDKSEKSVNGPSTSNQERPKEEKQQEQSQSSNKSEGDQNKNGSFGRGNKKKNNRRDYGKGPAGKDGDNGKFNKEDRSRNNTLERDKSSKQSNNKKAVEEQRSSSSSNKVPASDKNGHSSEAARNDQLKQNGFVNPAEERKISGQDATRSEQQNDRRYSKPRNEDNVPPRMRDRNYDSSRGGGSRMRGGGGGRGRGGGRYSRGSSPARSESGRNSESRRSSPNRGSYDDRATPLSNRGESPQPPSSTTGSNRNNFRRPNSPPPRRNQHSSSSSNMPPTNSSPSPVGSDRPAMSSGRSSNVRSPSPSNHNRGPDARRSHSPSRRPFSPIRGGGGGGNQMRGQRRGSYRDSSDWGQRYFRDGFQNQDDYYYHRNDRGYNNRYDDRRYDERDKYPRGKPPSGKAKSQTPKLDLPPRFQRGKNYRNGEEPEDQGTYTLTKSSPMEDERWRATPPFDRANDTDEAEPKSMDQSYVSDWSLEVEEEEAAERLDYRRPSADRASSGAGSSLGYSSVNERLHSSGSSNVGGLIKLPSDIGSNQPWQQQQQQQQQQQPQNSQTPQDSNNPAWRGVPPDHAYQMQRANANAASAGNGGGNGQMWRTRFLYDPKNPNKPIPAQGVTQNGGNVGPPHRDMQLPPPQPPQRHPMPPGGNGDPPGMMQARFPVDPRFPFPQNMGVPPHPYRPPFSGQAPPPPMNAPPHGVYPPPPPRPSGMPEWYDVYNLRIYGGDKHDVNVVTEIVRNDLKLRQIMAQGGGRLLCQLWDKDVAESRRTILMAFQHLLKTDLVFCAEFDIEFHIWKIGFYQLVEVLKMCLKDESPDLKSMVKHNISQLLDEGMDFYSAMLDTLDKAYRIDLERFYDVLEPRPTDKMIRCALVSVQKCLLCLGDLARYKEQINDTSNFGKARQYYQKACNIETRNGRPFNQLAILATANKRKFEAVYYNMRCLQSKNPFTSSQESLTVIFDEIKKKWETLEKKRFDEKEQKRKEAEKEKEGDKLIRGTRLRKEIWIRSEGGRRLHRTTSAHEGNIDSEETELRDLSTSDLNKRFNNSFLYLIGKLFTNINMDTFPLASELLYKEFRILVSRSPLPLDSKRLVQIMALNMFVIEHTKMKGGDSDDYRSAMQDSALQLAFEMFGILIERCNTLLESFQPELTSSSQSLFPEEDLPTLLSAVKVWCDWLLGNNDTWYPIVSEEPFSQLAKLATHLEKLKPRLTQILRTFISEEHYLAKKDPSIDFELIKLEEDGVLCGFNPWFRGLDWSIYRRFCPRNVPSPLAQDIRRIDAINFCIDYLEGLEHPILKWSPADHSHISLVDSHTSTAERVNAKLSNMIARQQDILEESYSDDEENQQQRSASVSNDPLEQNVGDSKIMKLKQRKEELERRKIEEEKEVKRMQQQILSEHVSVTLEIRPRYIIADTNCFVDYLPEIKKIVSKNIFQLRVPLVVLNELDGLARGAPPKKYATQEHAAMVSENARRALNFLRERPANTKCITSRGRVMPSLGVTTEEDNEEGKTNDDLILDACLNISENRTEDRNKMRIVYRDTVLLTDDRNLKLKAHTTDIPVNKLSDFVQWVNQSS